MLTALSASFKQALVQTGSRAEGYVLLTATDVRSKWEDDCRGTPDAETVWSAGEPMPDWCGESASAYLHRQLTDCIHVERDHIGHSYNVLGASYGSSGAVDHDFLPQRASASCGFARGDGFSGRMLGPERANRCGFTVVKMVDYSYKLSSAIPEDAVFAAPPPQLFKATPSWNLTKKHRSGPRSSRLTDSLNRIGSAF